MQDAELSWSGVVWCDPVCRGIKQMCMQQLPHTVQQSTAQGSTRQFEHRTGQARREMD